MAKDKQITDIKGIFKVTGKGTYNPTWSLDASKLKEIVKNEDCFNEIKESFYDMHDMTRFNAQIKVRNFEGNSSGKLPHYVISLGHFIYTYHFTYYPSNDKFYKTTLNQEFFEDIVQPFQKSLKDK